MRVLIDATCAEFGGIRTYVEHLLDRWHHVYPDDELHVLMGEGLDLPTPGCVRHEVPFRRPKEIGRPVAQTTGLRRLTRELRPDVVLATLPSTTVLHPGVPTTVVLYDLRHELRPEQFTRKRRVLRRYSYARGYSIADAIVSISQRSLDDLHRLHPRMRRTPGHVVHLGADHVARWPQPAPGAERSGPAVAFGHQSNKNVDLVLDAWGELVRRGVDVPVLRLLGVGGSARPSVEAAVAERGLEAHVEVGRFLPDDEFAAVLTHANLIVFPTDFEGFGLPVVEGMALGIPVVIGPEPATQEIAGGHAAVATAFEPAAVADAVEQALGFDAEQLAAARAHGLEFTWDRVVRQTRAVLASTLASSDSSPRP